MLWTHLTKSHCLKLIVAAGANASSFASFEANKDFCAFVGIIQKGKIVEDGELTCISNAHILQTAGVDLFGYGPSIGLVATKGTTSTTPHLLVIK